MALPFKRTDLPGIPPMAMEPHYALAVSTTFEAYARQHIYLVAFQMRMKGPPDEQAQRKTCSDRLGVTVHPVWWHEGYVYGTALLTDADLPRLHRAAADTVTRFDVALVERIQRLPFDPRLQVGPGAVKPEKCAGEVLYALIDNGLPFASTRLRVGNGSRILNFWDQDGRFQMAGAGAPQGWPFGSSTSGVNLDSLWQNRDPADDWAIYREAGLPELGRDASHGAHLLGCLFGAHASSSLLWGGVLDRAPKPYPPRPLDPQHPRDLVFVQLPTRYVEGAARGVLAPFRLAALRYVLDCAGPRTSRIVVPVASENYDGSHDGESLYDVAIDAMVRYAEVQQKKDLVLLVSAGNCMRTNTHERVILDGGVSPSSAEEGGQREASTHTFIVRALPGTERPTTVEIWVPHALDGLEFDLQTPDDTGNPNFQSGDGVWIVWDGTTPWSAMVSLRQPSSLSGFQRCVLLLIPPTQPQRGAGGIVGDWRITVRAPANVRGDVLAYIARMTPGLGGHVRGYQSTFPRKFSRDWDFSQEVPAGQGRPFDEYSLSGLATGGEITVVGGYELRTRLRSRYSAGGPGRKPARHSLFLIDAASPTEQSSVLPGMLGWGNRSAGFFRMEGTSLASPFAARALVAPYSPRPHRFVGLGPGAGREDPQIPAGSIL